MDFRVSKQRLNDPNLVFDVYGRMIDRLDAFGTNEGEILSAAARGQRVLYILNSVEGEINNGGFHQLFWNATGEFVDEAIAYAGELGATRERELLRDAASIFPDGVPEDPDERQEVLESLPKELSEDRLDAISSRWYAQELSFEPYLRKYIRAHPDEFFFDS